MWHETEDEQLEMLKSLFRIDSDYHRRKMAKEHLRVSFIFVHVGGRMYI